MSFPFSIDDMIAVGKLVVDVTNSLRSYGGSKAEYQYLQRELKSLQTALHIAEQLQQGELPSHILDAIRSAALNCRQPLEDFKKKIHKFERTLGMLGNSKTIRATSHKLAWTFSYKEDVRNLRGVLNFQMSTINALLAALLLENMQHSTSSAKRNALQMNERLDENREVLREVRTNTASQVVTLSHIQSSFNPETLQHMYAATQQMQAMLKAMQQTRSSVDIGHTWFQAPFIVQDPFRFRHQIAAEADYDLIVLTIRHYWKDHKLAKDIDSGNFEIRFQHRVWDVKELALDIRNYIFQTRKLSNNDRFLPGAEMKMTIVRWLTGACDLKFKPDSLLGYRNIKYLSRAKLISLNYPWGS